MTISVDSFEGIVEALLARGFLFLVDVKWIKQPCRCSGCWSCEVMP
jgi:hypothetical protein